MKSWYTPLLVAVPTLCVALIGIVWWSRQMPTETFEERFRREVYASMLEEEAMAPELDGGPPATFSAFFQQNRRVPASISPEEFEHLLAADPQPFILDAREDEEHALGHFTDSLHIRYADLRAGAWKQLPTDRIVYVFCYSGVRGEFVTKFLRSRGILAQSVESGAGEWVDNAPGWEGTIDFYGQYDAQRYVLWMPEAAYQQLRQLHAVVVDARPAYKYAQGHLPDAVNIPLLMNPTPQLDAAIRRLPQGVPIVTVCDDYSSCFDATLVGVRAEKQGYRFAGLYNMLKDSYGNATASVAAP